MSSCLKDLYDYDLVKKCNKCEIVLLKSKFHDILKQSKFTDHEINIIKNLALEKSHRLLIIKDYFAVSLIE